MRILVISQYYYPEQFKINDICEDLVAKGHSVKVITGLPNYPFGKIFDGYKQKNKRNESINGVFIERCFLFARGESTIGLALNYLSFMVSASIKTYMMKEEYDLVLVYQLSPILMVIPGIIYKKKHKVPLYLYCLDLWPESLKVNIKNEENIIYKFIKYISTKIYQTSDMVGITSKPFSQYFKEVHQIDEIKLKYLPQHGNDIYPNLNYEENSTINISYFGNIGRAQDFDLIINNIDKLNDSIQLHIIGSGSEYYNLNQKIRDRSLSDKIILHGYKQRSELYELYSMTDICLLTLKSNSWIDKTLPAKMIEYLSTNKPILAIAEGAVQDLINESQCGYCVGFDRSSDLIDIINLLSTNKELRDRLGMNGRSYFDKNFTKEIFMKKLEEQLNHLIGDEKHV